MTGNDSILDISVPALWRAWQNFKVGKRRTAEFEQFFIHLERNLFTLHSELENYTYRHGSYRCFTVTYNKRREIAVANIRDRVVHRLLYDYLVPIFDPMFDYDVWSCRRSKGQVGAVYRARQLAKCCQNGYFWRADIKKFFDSIDRGVLREGIKRRVNDLRARWLINEVTESYGAAVNTHTHTHTHIDRARHWQLNESDLRQHLFA